MTTPGNASGAGAGTADARDRARRVLAGSSAFQACMPAVIDEIMQHAVLVKLPRGDAMYRQGEEGDSMMVVLSGSLKITNVTADGKEVVLGFLKSGALIGEINLPFRVAHLHLDPELLLPHLLQLHRHLFVLLRGIGMILEARKPLTLWITRFGQQFPRGNGIVS